LLPGASQLRPDARPVADLAALADQGLPQRSGLACPTTRSGGDRLPQEGQRLHVHRRLRASPSVVGSTTPSAVAAGLGRVGAPVPPDPSRDLRGGVPAELLLDRGAIPKGGYAAVRLDCFFTDGCGRSSCSSSSAFNSAKHSSGVQ